MIKVLVKPLSVNKYSLFQKLIEQELNVNLVPEYRFDNVRMFRFDFAIPEMNIAIEIEGGVTNWNKLSRHTTPTGYVKDLEKYNLATVQGWKVLRFTTKQLYNIETLELIKKAIEFKD